MALALRPGQFKFGSAISEDDWKQVVHGDTFTRDDLPIKKGWVRLFCNGQPVALLKWLIKPLRTSFQRGCGLKLSNTK